MREPIIIEADDGFYFIATHSFAEVSIEANDIESGIRVYDADGLNLDMAPAPNGAVIISYPVMPTDCSVQLVPKLREFLRLGGVPQSSISDASFAELVQLGVDRFLEQEPEPIGPRLWAAIRGLFRGRHAA